MKKNLQTAVLMHDAYWAIEPQAAQAILAQLGATDPAAHRAEFEAARGYAEDRDSKPYDMFGATAIISVSGPMTKKGSSFGSGGTIETRNLIRRASNDADVKSILLVWDSPGGSVAGTEDLGNDIASAAAKKEVVSFIEDTCCSAALWCACQARAVYANSTAIVGSIGVFSYAVDMSRMAENAGIKVHLLSTGKYKGSGAVDGVPIDPDQLAEMQATVDSLGDHFVVAMARGRKMDPEDIKEIADGRVWVGAEAVGIGLIDGISTRDDVLQGLQRPGGMRSMAAEATEGPSALLSPGVLVIDPTNSFASNLPLTGMTMEQSLDSALTAVEGSRRLVEALSERIAAVHDIRASQRRAFSPSRLKQLEALDAEVTELALGMEALAAQCKALESPPAATQPVAPDPAPNNVNRVLLDAAFDQAIA